MIKATPFYRTSFFVLADSMLALFTLLLAYKLRFNFHLDSAYMDNFWVIYGILVVIKITIMWLMKIYQIPWRFFSLADIKKLILSHLISYLLLLAVLYLFPKDLLPFPRSILIIDLFLSLLFVGGLRILKRLLVEGQIDQTSPKSILVGLTSMSQSIFKDNHDFQIVSIVDDSTMIANTYVANKKVYPFEKIEELVNSFDITTAIIGKEFELNKQREIYKRLNDVGIHEIYVMGVKNKEKNFKKVTLEELLARNPHDLDMDLVADFIKDKKVLITGAGGSIGSEISRQCHALRAHELVLLDNSEYNLYQIGEQIPSATLKLLDITSRDLVDKSMEYHRPDIVIHAAAYKHVPICEDNKAVAIRNNIQGSMNIIDSAIENSVKKLVIISTDKAVRPTNVMGATKRVVELYAQNIDSGETEIVSVRFGNVLGSSGSVIPKFRQQIENGGPVTVTHPDITRYFMLIPEACQLVLQAAAMAKGGELFILDMGEPIKIADLAKQMIRLSSKESEVSIEYTGLRPGEKLYEELLIDDSEQKTKYSSIFIARPTKYDISQLVHDIRLLLEGEDKIAGLQKIVPEFTRKD